jgi:antitoxin VapB
MALTDENSETESFAPDETPSDRLARLRRFLEEKVWPHVPPEVRGKRITKEEEEEILGYGPDGC